MAEQAYYQIGDIVLNVCSDLPYPIPESTLKDFRVDEKPEDYRYRFERVDNIPLLTGKTKTVSSDGFAFDMLDEKGQALRGFYWKDRIYDTVLRWGEKEAQIAYVSSQIMAERCQQGLDFASYFGLETLFLRNSGLFLHSSHVNVNGRALIFSAPSGTGKSTQADLWEKHAGAEVMNGDRTLLRKKDGVWHAYGCPMCGTSGIHKQGNEPIHAIVMLSQGTDNAVRKLTPGEAFQRMYPEITVPKWNRELVLRAMELLDDVMANVPIYAFSCTKDERAVTALREAIGL